MSAPVLVGYDRQGFPLFRVVTCNAALQFDRGIYSFPKEYAPPAPDARKEPR